MSLERAIQTEVLADLHKKYGSVVKLWLGPTQLLVSIKDPTLIRDMLLKAANKLPMTGRAFHLAFGSLHWISVEEENYKVQEHLELAFPSVSVTHEDA